MKRLATELVAHKEIRIGDRIVATFGICRVSDKLTRGDRVTFILPGQGTMTQHTSNDVERVIGPE